MSLWERCRDCLTDEWQSTAQITDRVQPGHPFRNSDVTHVYAKLRILEKSGFAVS